jgi:hypothetical protein
MILRNQVTHIKMFDIQYFLEKETETPSKSLQISPIIDAYVSFPTSS